MPKKTYQKYGFKATFVLYKNDKEIYGKIPLQKFYIKSDKRSEFWNKLGELEKKLSIEYGGKVHHLVVTSLQDIPKTDIKKNDIVVYNPYEL